MRAETARKSIRTRHLLLGGAVVLLAAGAAKAAEPLPLSPPSPPAHPRSAWWPFATGPRYGDVEPARLNDAGVLRTRVGSFAVPGPGLRLPEPLRRGRDAAASPAGGLYWIVAFDGPIGEARRQSVLDSGAALVDYLANYAYIVRCDRGSEVRLRSLEGVLWVGPFEPAYRIDPALGALPTREERKVSAPDLQVRIALFPGEPAVEMAMRLGAAGATVTEIVPGGSALIASLPKREVAAVARVEGVAVIEEVPEYRLWSAESQEVLQSGSVPGGRPYWDAGVHGSGQIVAVMDNGLDVDTTAMAQSASDAGTPGPSHRKVVSYTAYGGGDKQTCSGGAGVYIYSHGTNVTENAVGQRSGIGYDDEIDGVGHRARVVFQDNAPTDFSHCHFGTVVPPASLTAALTDAYNAGSRLHNFSFGGGSPYAGHATDCDGFLWDHRDYMIFVAAGNSGASGLNDPAGGKNLMCIGGSDQDPRQNERYADSSLGPAPDGRIAPVVVAPATDTLGAAGNPAPNGYATSVYLSDRDGDIVGVPGNDVLQGYSGTSFASPMAMGAAVLVRDYLAQGFHPSGKANPPDARNNPSGALVKALLLASADHMTCASCGGARGNNSIGLGRINLSNVLPLAGSARTVPALIVEDRGQTTGLRTGQSFERKFRVISGARPLRAVLAWIDKSGSPLANDLRLTLTGPAAVWRGNNFDGEWSASTAQGGTTDDVRNPWEAVMVAPADTAYGVWTAKVEGVNVAWPDARFGNTEPFALAISGDLETRWPPEVSGRGAPSLLALSRLDTTTSRLTWEGFGDPSLAYDVYRGTLAALRTGSYDHGQIGPATCRLAVPTADVADLQDGVSHYYLVVAVSGANRGSAGTASSGLERPPGNPSCP